MFRGLEQLLLAVAAHRQAEAVGQGRGIVVQSPREYKEAERAGAGEAGPSRPVQPAAPAAARTSAQAHDEPCKEQGGKQVDAQLGCGHARDQGKDRAQRAGYRFGYGPVIRRDPFRTAPCGRARGQT